jgi:hypothetical protein
MILNGTKSDYFWILTWKAREPVDGYGPRDAVIYATGTRRAV